MAQLMDRNHSTFLGAILSMIALACLLCAVAYASPSTIVIQGKLADASGKPLSGARLYRVQFYDALTTGQALGAAIQSLAQISNAGRFSIEVAPPAEAFAAGELYYELAIDSATPIDNVIDPSDVFPNRVRVASVMYAQALAGVLNVSGDRLQLGSNAYFEVNASGNVELVVNGQRNRLATQRWRNPTGLQDNISPNGQSAGLPQVAMDNNGNAIITWYQPTGAGTQIFKSEYRGGAWSHPSSLSDNISPDGQSAYNSQVAMDSKGNAIVVWYQSDGANFQIFKSEYRGGAWMHPSLTDKISPGGTDAYDPHVGMDDNGNAIIAWHQDDTANSQIFKSEYRSGVWTHPASVVDTISPTGQTADSSQVAMDNNGAAIITWRQWDGANYQICKSEYRSGAWMHPSALSDNISPDGQDAYNPQVAMDNTGAAIITWYQLDGGNLQIFKSEYRSGAWTHPSSLSDNISPDGQHTWDPQVALDNNGNAIIAWYQFDGAQNQIYKSEYRSSIWTHPASLSDHVSLSGQNADTPQVAMSASGAAEIVWEQPDGANYQIFKAEYRGGAWKKPSSFSDHPSQGGTAAYKPQVAMDGDGNAIITWTQFDGAQNQIFKSECAWGF